MDVVGVKNGSSWEGVCWEGVGRSVGSSERLRDSVGVFASHEKVFFVGESVNEMDFFSKVGLMEGK